MIECILSFPKEDGAVIQLQESKLQEIGNGLADVRNKNAVDKKLDSPMKQINMQAEIMWAAIA